ncbi:hypothetical protein ABEV41_08100 [Geobacillus thermodenitrificans]|uniref:hypothetical protein n=1 Tax=Geobacillus thermodenitrificans TaxID=33940 RepID=UPI003D246A92
MWPLVKGRQWEEEKAKLEQQIAEMKDELTRQKESIHETVAGLLGSCRKSFINMRWSTDNIMN